jgi:hypothetical protein
MVGGARGFAVKSGWRSDLSSSLIRSRALRWCATEVMDCSVVEAKFTLVLSYVSNRFVHHLTNTDSRMYIFDGWNLRNFGELMS